MTIYGQFCPVSKAVELLGERWTLLVLRELLLGSTRFNELQRGLANMSPSLLTKRLKELEAAGLLVRKKITGQKGYSYHLTEGGKQLKPLIIELAKWGFKWAANQISHDELDLDLLMLDMQRGMDAANFPSSKTVLKFHFSDASHYANWWLICEAGSIDVCTEHPGYEADVYLTTDVKTLTEIWTGNIRWSAALSQKRMTILGNTLLVKQIPHWIGESQMAVFNPQYSAG